MFVIYSETNKIQVQSVGLVCKKWLWLPPSNDSSHHLSHQVRIGTLGCAYRQPNSGIFKKCVYYKSHQDVKRSKHSLESGSSLVARLNKYNVKHCSGCLYSIRRGCGFKSYFQGCNFHCGHVLPPTVLQNETRCTLGP